MDVLEIKQELRKPFGVRLKPGLRHRLERLVEQQEAAGNRINRNKVIATAIERYCQEVEAKSVLEQIKSPEAA